MRRTTDRVRRDDAAKSEGDDLREQVVALAPFTAADAERLAELDRSEPVPMLYTVRSARTSRRRSPSAAALLSR